MKKLLLLLVLTASFSAFAHTVTPMVPCGPPVDVEAAKVSVEYLEVERKTLITQLEELKIENEDLNDINKEDLDRSSFAKRRLHILQLSREINERIKTLGAEIDEKKGDIKYLEWNNFYKELCKQSPEGLSLDGIKVVENGIRVGKWTWYDEFNRVTKQGNYVNGKKEGQWTERIFSSGGHSAYDTIEMHYKNDKLEGKWTHWYSYPGLSVSEENSERKQWEEALLGLLIYEQAEIWVESQLSDEPKKYEYRLSQLEGQIQHKALQLQNMKYPRIIEEGNYINGKKEGTWTYWGRSGNRQIPKEEAYEDGVLIEK